MPRWLYLVPVLVFVALVGYFAAGLTRDPHLVPSVLIGRPVPAFTLPPLPGLGAGLDSAALATGRPQLLNVFASWYGNPFTSIGADPEGRVAIDFGVYGVPETFVIDGQGRILDKHVGPLAPEDVEPLIRKVHP